MYYKYFGVDKDTGTIRVSFLCDGLFRFTQPKYLNDPKEARPKFYIDKYSPKDLSRARMALMKELPGLFPFGKVSDKDAITFALNPFPSRRLGNICPHLIHQEGYKSMAEYDRIQLVNEYKIFNDQLNKEIGVFSLTQDNKNEVMWASYGNDYNGIVVEFSEDLRHLDNYISSEIDYNLDKVSFELSLNQGIIRFNGINVKKLENKCLTITDELISSFLFHKEKKWSYEKEFRLISKLKNAKKICGNVYLEKLPFHIFKAVYIGQNVKESERELILTQISKNKELSHIDIFIQTFNKLSGQIEFEKIHL